MKRRYIVPQVAVIEYSIERGYNESVLLGDAVVMPGSNMEGFTIIDDYSDSESNTFWD